VRGAAHVLGNRQLEILWTGIGGLCKLQGVQRALISMHLDVSATFDVGRFVALVLSMAEKVFTNGGRSNGREAICATHLLLSLLHNAHGRVDAAVGPILGLVLARLSPQPTPTEVSVRIPDGCVEGQPIPVKVLGEKGSVPCPPGAAPGSEVTITVTLPPEPVPDLLKLSLLQVFSRINV